jgi:hypothetical protein
MAMLVITKGYSSWDLQIWCNSAKKPPDLKTWWRRREFFRCVHPDLRGKTSSPQILVTHKLFSASFQILCFVKCFLKKKPCKNMNFTCLTIKLYNIPIASWFSPMIFIKTCFFWLVVSTYPSEKWWSSSVGVTTFPIYGQINFMFQTTIPCPLW